MRRNFSGKPAHSAPRVNAGAAEKESRSHRFWPPESERWALASGAGRGEIDVRDAAVGHIQPRRPIRGRLDEAADLTVESFVELADLGKNRFHEALARRIPALARDDRRRRQSDWPAGACVGSLLLSGVTETACLPGTSPRLA